MKARKHLWVSGVSLAPVKVVGQVNDVGWKQPIVLAKPTAKPVGGADKIAKLCKERGSLE